MKGDLEILRGIAPEPERMTAVRRRVLDQIAEHNGPRGLLLLAWTFSAVAAAVAMMLLWPQEKRLAPSWIHLPAAVEPPAFAYELTPPWRGLQEPQPATARPEHPAIEVVGLTDNDVQLRLASSDPDVILYYFVEKSGD